MNRGEPVKNELEDQFILRLPLEQAKIIRKILRKKPKKLKKHLSIELDAGLRYGVIKVHGKTLHGKLVNMPTIIESNKTVDGVHLFKTADLSQMLVCQEDEYERNDAAEDYGKTKVLKAFSSRHGYTPPLKNIRKFRFRKTLRNTEAVEEAADIEKEILWLLRMDNEAVFSRFELVYDVKTKVRPPIINEHSIFGEKLNDLDSDRESSSGDVNDIMDFTH